MFKFIRRLFLICFIFFIVLIGGIMYISYQNYSNVVKDLTTVSNNKEFKNNSANNNDNNADIESSDYNSNFSLSDIKNSTETATISQVMSDIVSDDNNYDLLVKCDDVSALVYLNKETKKVSMVSLENVDDFHSLSSKTDKYLNLDNYSVKDLEELKDSFISGDMSKKLSIINKVLNTSDTNIKESDLINIYFSYASD